jgi:hypothetical protein
VREEFGDEYIIAEPRIDIKDRSCVDVCPVERAFPTVHAAHRELARRCYEAGPLDERSARLVKLGSRLARKPREPSARTPAARSPSRRVRRSSAMSACSP